MFHEGAEVYYPIENDPDRGGGPIRRSPLVTTRSGDGMPPHGWPQMVTRTPHQAVYEPEPGGAGYAWLSKMKFLPDGRLVPAGALGSSFGAPTWAAPIVLAVTGTGDPAAATAATRLLTFGALAGVFLGSVLGAATAARAWRGAGLGAALGLGSGLVAVGIVGRAAVLASDLVAARQPRTTP